MREPVVAGMFYDGDAVSLKKHISRYLENPPEVKIKAKGIVVPHAGIMYSGFVAGEVYKSVHIPKTVVILGPNHTGIGAQVSVMREQGWKTPLGAVPINTALAGEIIKKCSYAADDSVAHSREHSIEVQLPFLQSLRDDFDFVPICLSEPDLNGLDDLAKVLASATAGKDVMLIASTDLTHYEHAESAREKDSMVLSAIEALDAEAMLDAIAEKDISMCGWMPTYVVLKACRLLGATQGRVLRYMNSGDTTGDIESVVGYGGAVII